MTNVELNEIKLYLHNALSKAESELIKLERGRNLKQLSIMNELEAEHVRQNSIMMKQKREDKTGMTRRKVMFGS